jgi:hypothetical protein
MILEGIFSALNQLQRGIICLHDFVVSAPFIDSFKNKLDEFSLGQNMKFSSRDDIAEIGNRTSNKNSVKSKLLIELSGCGCRGLIYKAQRP